jgi:hypothetical protein
MSLIGNLGQGILGSRAEKNAARQRVQGINEAKDYVTQGYNEGKGYFNPYYQTGTAANNRLAELMGIGGNSGAEGYGSLMKNFGMADYQADPGYQFRLQEGLKQLDSAAKARGGLLSGATLKGTQRYAQDKASEEYGNAYTRYMEQNKNRYNMLAGQQGVGYQAGNALANLGSTYGASMGNLAMGIGNARAAGTIGSANAWSQALGRTDQEAENLAKNILRMG